MTFILTLIFTCFLSGTAGAGCFLDCLSYPGAKCVNNECVRASSVSAATPTPTSAPIASEIRIESKPVDQISVQHIDCTGMDLKKLKVFLVRKAPPPPASFYSAIFYFYVDTDQKTQTEYFFARKDILSRYVFTLFKEKEAPKPQFVGEDFAFNLWENLSFRDFISLKTCSELKQAGMYYSFGISIKGDLSDFEGATFTFK